MKWNNLRVLINNLKLEFVNEFNKASVVITWQLQLYWCVIKYATVDSDDQYFGISK